MKNLKERAKKYFEDYKSKTEVHFTSDGQAFFEKNPADNHASSLGDKTINTIQRSEVIEETLAAASGTEKLEDSGNSIPANAKVTSPTKPLSATKQNKGKSVAAKVAPVETENGNQGSNEGGQLQAVENSGSGSDQTPPVNNSGTQDQG